MKNFLRLSLLLFFGSFLLKPISGAAQCSLSDLSSTYCVDAPNVNLVNGTNYYGNGISGSTFSPATAGVGTHQIVTTNGSATSYVVNTSGTFAPLASGSATVLTGMGSNEERTVSIGFTFNFFGTNYTQVRVASNGVIGFGATPSLTSIDNNQALSNGADPNNLIALAWDNLSPNLGTGVISYFVTGTAPFRRMVINYANVRIASAGSASITTQAQLHETTNVIEIHTTNAPFDTENSTATQGIEGPGAGATVSYGLASRNNAEWNATNDFISFVPTCLEIKLVTVTDLPLNQAVTAAPNVCFGSGASITIASSQIGVQYQLRDNATNAALSGYFAGTGSSLAIVSDALTANTTIKVYAQNTTTLCDRDLSATVALTVVTPPVANAGTDASICGLLYGLSATPASTGTGAWSQVSGPGTASFSSVNSPTSNATVSTAGVYVFRWTITSACPTTSDDVQITYVGFPAITTGPADAVVCEGGSTSFSVTATGAGLTYEWKDNMDNPIGSNSPTLNLSGLTSAQAGIYTVTVKGTCDMTTGATASATLTVGEEPVILSQPVSVTICENTNTSFTVGVGPVTGISYQWQVSTNGGTSYTNLTNTGPYSGVATATLTLTNTPLANNGNLYRVVVTGTCASTVNSNGVGLTVQQSPVITLGPSNVVACEGANVNFTVAAAGTGLTYEWKNSGGVTVGTAATLNLSNVTAANAGTYTVTVRGSCNSTGVTASATLTVNEVPEIMAQPASVTICENTNTSFTVGAGATTGVSYQWQVSTNGGTSYTNLTNTAPYSGVATATLTLTSTPLANNGYLYRAVVSGSCTPPVNSNGASLTVQQTPVITTGPANVVACEGANVNFTIAASGTGLTYEWKNSGGVTVGTAATLNLSNVTAANAGTYTVTVRGSCNSTGVTASATLAVNEVPEILAQPASVTICENTNTSFTVGAGATTGVSYQWQVSTNGGTSYTNLTNTAPYSGVATATLTLTSTPLANNGYLYRAVVSGSCTPPVNSNGASLTVQQTPVITLGPSNVVACEGANVNFTVAASGTGLTYEWKNSGGVTVGAAATLNLSNVTAANAGVYTVTVKGSCNSTGVTASATLTVNEVPEILAQPASVTICENTNTTFTVDAGVTTGVSYQWQVSTNGGTSYTNLTNTAPYSGVATATLTLTSTPLASNGYLYRAVVSGSCTPPVNSNGASLTVQQTPVITTGPANVVACEGANVSFTVAASGTGLTYEWKNSGGVTVGTAATLTMPNVTAASAGTYTVTVKGSCNSTGVTASATLTVNEAPEILAQPASVTICENTNTTFTVDAGVTTGVTYQWQVSINGGTTYTSIADGAVYAGTNTPTLTLTNTPLANNGFLYRVVISGTCAPAVNSNGATLNIQQTPVINTAPSNVVACEGSNVSFTVSAAGTGLTYEWQDSGGAIVGTAATLTIPNVTAASAGTYTVTVKGSCNTTGVTASATLTVNEVPEILAQPTSVTICENTNSTFTVDAGVTTGVTYQWQVSTNGGTSYTNLTETAPYNGSATDALTITNAPFANNGFLYRVVISGTCTPPVNSNGAALNVQQTPAINTPPSNVVACEGSNVSFTVAASGTGLTYEWQDSGGAIVGTAATLTMPNVTAASAGTYTVTVKGSCNTTGVTASATLTVNEAPEILAQPASVTICENTNTTFTVDAGVTTGVTYQWQVSTNGGTSYTNLTETAPYSGSATDALTITNAPFANNGFLYRVVISGICAPPVNSNGATLNVQQTPVITTGPVNVVACEGANVSFTVSAAGTGLTYEWQDSGGAIVGTAATLTIPNVTAANAGTYTVTVKGSCNTTGVTASATLTVNEVPEILAQPASVTICENTNTTFTVDAGVTTGVTYQWQVSTNGGTSYTNLTETAPYSGSATDALTITNAPFANNGFLYRVVISGICAPPVNSNGATLNVQQTPVITTGPVNVVACEGANVSFTVSAAGTGLTYEWQDSGGAIVGTAASLTIPNVTAADADTYTVTVKGSCNTTGVTASATLTVNEVPEILAQPASVTICENTNTTFTVDAGVTTGVTYQWQVSINGGTTYTSIADGAVYAGTNTATLTLTNTPLANNGFLYRVVISGTCTPPVNSNGASLTVQQTPVITTGPSNVVACEGANVNFTVAASGTGLTYEWKNSGGVTVGTAATLNLSNVTAASAGTYTVTVKGSCNTTGVTASATLTVNEVPEILAQPASVTICENTNTTFTVDAGVTTGVTYQWQVSTNGGTSYTNLTETAPYSGSATDALTITNAPFANNGFLYRVVISGTCTPPVNSNGATLNVQQTPVINTAPSNVVACEGSNVSFTVSAAGTGLTYEWQDSGGAIVGTAATLTIQNVTAADADTYAVTVKGSCNTTGVTASATLTVNEVPEILAQPASVTICENTNTTFTVDAGVTTGVTYQWQVSINGGTTYTSIADGAVYAGTNTAALTLTNTPQANNGFLYRVVISGTCTPPVNSNGATLNIQQTPVINTAPSNVVACEGSNVSFTVSAAGTGLTYEWQDSGGAIVGTAATLTIPNVTAASAGTYTVTVKGSCNTTGVTASATLTVNEVPEILAQPASVTICENTNTTFTVDAGVTTGVTYQWQVSINGGTTYTSIADGAVYGGTNTATLTVTNTPLANNGFLYRIVISGTCAPPVNSNGAALNVQQTPVINTPPSNVVACEGSNVSFTVAASGTGLTYEWQDSGGAIVGTAATLTIPNVTAASAGTYTVTVKGSCNTTGVTASATLTVNEVPEILAQPASVTICENTNTSFTIDAGVTTGVTYQWQVSINGGTTYTSIADGAVYAGTNTPTLTLTNTPLANNGFLYRVVVNGTCTPPVSSNGAALNVQQTPAINTPPSNVVACEGSNVSFTVAASGTGLTYEWKNSGGVTVGTAATLNLSNVTAASADTYTVTVKGSCNTTGVTASATLIVNEVPEILAQPASVTICENTNTTFTVDAGVTTGVTYQWQVSINGGTTYTSIADGAVYAGTNTATLTLTNTPLANNGFLYRVVISGTCAPAVNSNGATLNIQQTPLINTPPSNVVACEGSNVTFTVSATGTGLTYEWQDSGGAIVGTAASLTIPNVTAANADTYTVTVKGSCNTTGVTASATLTVNEVPEILAQPASVTICENTNTTFTVDAGVTTGVTYQWQVSINGGTTYTSIADGAVYGGTNTATLTVTNTPLANNGFLYRVVISGTCAPAVNSNGAALNVQQTPLINTPPSNVVACEGSNVSFTVSAVGTGLTYEWQDSGGATVGTASILNLSSVTASDADTYTVTVKGTCNNAGVTASATLTINEIPEIIAHPVSVTICENSATSFTVDAGITTGVGYQWQVSTNGGTSYTNIADGLVYAGTNTANLALNNTPLANNGFLYRVVVSGTCSPSINSNGALLTVQENPVITVQPVGAFICQGTSYDLTVTAQGTNLSYQWVKDGIDFGPPASVPVLSLKNVQPSDGGDYLVRITGVGCAPVVLSNVAVVTVQELPVNTNAHADLAIQICSGAPLTFAPTFSLPGTTYSWTSAMTGEITSGVSSSGSSFASEAPVNTLSVYGIVTYNITPALNGCNGPDFKYVVTVKPVPSAFVGNKTICSGDNTGLVITAAPKNVAGTAFTWTVFSASPNISGALPGSGTDIDQVLTTDNTTGTVTYAITPAANGCFGPDHLITVTVNPVPTVDAGLDEEFCEPASFVLTGTIGNGATSGSWTVVESGALGLSGSTVTGNVVTATYTVTGADLDKTYTFVLTTNDTDNGGPCIERSDIKIVTIHALPEVALSELKSAYAENDPVQQLKGFPTKDGTGLFSGNGIVDQVAGLFDPQLAGPGIHNITYEFTSSITGCSNSDTKTTTVNPLTDIDFEVGIPARRDFDGDLLVCNNQGEVILVGYPPASSAVFAEFFSADGQLDATAIVKRVNDWYIDTDVLLENHDYYIGYRYDNGGAVSTLIKKLHVYGRPKADIEMNAVCVDQAVTFLTGPDYYKPSDAGTIGYYWSYGEAGRTSINFTTPPGQETPQYTYESSGVKQVIFQMLTSTGCFSSDTTDLLVAEPPVVDFSYTQLCSEIDATGFTDLTPSSSLYNIVEHEWNFSDGSPVIRGNSSDAISGADSNGGQNTGIYKDLFHLYAAFGNYPVTLTVHTAEGCSASKTRNTYILDYGKLTPPDAYFTDFESGVVKWVAPIPELTSENDNVQTSWVFGTPSGQVINSAASGANAWWTGKNTGNDQSTYYQNEMSEVLGPCLDLTSIERPMLSIDYWADTQDRVDGLVVQYSVDGAQTWQTLGDGEGGGINWYNSRNTFSRPGDQTNNAWTGETGGWRTARFNLDQITDRSLVVFRLAFASVSDPGKEDHTLEGFAFDNVYIGEKYRNVLVEDFVNGSATTQFGNFLAAQTRPSDFIVMQHHMANPTPDPLNAANPVDPYARAQWYGVASPPAAVMDGIQGNYYGHDFNGDPSKLIEVELDRRALEDPEFNIDINLVNATEGPLTGTVTFTAGINGYEGDVMFQAVLVEDNLGDNINVVRKFMWGPQGNQVAGPFAPSAAQPLPLEFDMNVEVADPANLYVIAFAQDKVTKRILQTAIAKAPALPGVIVGLPEDLKASSLKHLNVYPNPSFGILKLQMDEELPADYKWQIIDQRGVSVAKGTVNRDLSTPQELDLKLLPGGVYFLQIQTGDRSVYYKKVAILR